MRHTIAEKVNEHVWIIINDEAKYVLVGEPNIPENRDLMTLMPQRKIYVLDEDGMVVTTTIVFDSNICFDTKSEAEKVLEKRQDEEIKLKEKLKDTYLFVAKNYCRTNKNGKENDESYITGFVDALMYGSDILGNFKKT